MKFDLNKVKGKYFTHPTSKILYGSIRDADSLVTKGEWDSTSMDDAGNLFLVSKKGEIGFWDHETDEIVVLADSFESFVEHVHEKKEVDLPAHKVKSTWVDPEFDKQVREEFSEEEK